VLARCRRKPAPQLDLLGTGEEDVDLFEVEPEEGIPGRVAVSAPKGLVDTDELETSLGTKRIPRPERGLQRGAPVGGTR